MRIARLLLFSIVVFIGTLLVHAQQLSSRVPAVFTAEQAEAGRLKIQANSFGACTDCHGSTLSGRSGAAGERPPLSSLSESYQSLIKNNGGRVPDLVGPAFMKRWGSRSTKDLTAEFEGRFSGSLPEGTRLELIAYILKANGASPGTEPLTLRTDVAIRTLTAEAN
jgi:cytochrome c553